ncbi:MAG: XkdF-like putative serine protease domain-containing protein [Lachnospiraceae bacterium]|nr:XkdF-like putative serine protease domain-containing protein [Lachnospiraceae bacterium]
MEAQHVNDKDILIVEGPVIPLGVTDADGNSPDAKQIKSLYTNFINQETDTMHSFLKNNGVTIIGNTILDVDKVIHGETIKAGSWTAITRVTNPELIKNIKNGKLTGYSLSTLPDFAKNLDYWISREKDEGNRKTYDDIQDFKEAEPKWISFVDVPNHGLGFDYWSREEFINKRKYFEEEYIMTEKNENNDNGILGQIASKLLDHALINKAEPPAQQPEAKPEENKDFVTKTELKTELDSFKTEILDSVKELIKEEKPSDEEEKKPEGKTQEPKSEKPENVKTPNPMVNKSFREHRREQGKIIY